MLLFRFILKKKSRKFRSVSFLRPQAFIILRREKKKWPNNVDLLKCTIVIRENPEQATNVTTSSQISYHF